MGFSLLFQLCLCQINIENESLVVSPDLRNGNNAAEYDNEK